MRFWATVEVRYRVRVACRPDGDFSRWMTQPSHDCSAYHNRSPGSCSPLAARMTIPADVLEEQSIGLAGVFLFRRAHPSKTVLPRSRYKPDSAGRRVANLN